jgi:hypothetical protein
MLTKYTRAARGTARAGALPQKSHGMLSSALPPELALRRSVVICAPKGRLNLLQHELPDGVLADAAEVQNAISFHHIRNLRIAIRGAIL